MWILFYSFCSPGVCAQPITLPDSLSFNQARALFLLYNPDLAAARSTARRLSLESRALALWPNPSLESDIEAASSQQSLVLEQPVPNLIVHRVQTFVSQAKSRAALATLHEAANDLYLELRRRYLYAVVAAFRSQYLENVTHPLKRAVEIAGVRLEEGDIGQYEFNRLNMALANYEDALAQAETDHQIALAALGVFIVPSSAVGSDTLGPHFILTDSLQNMATAFDATMLEEADTLQKRARFIAATADVEAAEQTLRATRAARWPGVSLRAGIGREISAGDNSIGPVIGLGLELPIWNRNSVQIRAAEAALAEVDSMREMVRREVQLEVQSARKRLQSYRTRLDRIDSTPLAGSASVLSDALVLYQEGEMSLLELLDAAGADRDANLLRIDLLRGYLESQYEFERAKGRLPDIIEQSIEPH